MKKQVVAINPDGIILDVEEYDLRKDLERDQRILDAIGEIVNRQNIARPEAKLMSRAVVATDGNEWGRMSGDIKPGMVEIGFGKWGFE